MTDDLPADVAAYAGRWVALVHGKIIAQGDTRDEVFKSARYSRSKEQAEIRFMPVMPLNLTLVDAVRPLIPVDLPVYLVGGAVRDAVLGRLTHDLDFATPHGLKLARKVADGLSAAYFPLDEAFDTARVILQNPDGVRDLLDFAGFRGDSLEADLRGRDFTINAVAMEIHTGEIFDPLVGLKDIREKRIRACSPTSLSDDPIRILRAVRMAAAFNFSIEPQTRGLMKSAVPLLPETSPERLRDELFKILEGPRAEAAIRALDLLGVFPYLLPELIEMKNVEQSAPHVHDVWTHTLAVMRHLDGILSVLAPKYDEGKANSDVMNGLLVMRLGRYREQIGQHLGNKLNVDRSARALLFLAALYHDVNKPQTKAIEENGRIRFFGHDEQGARTAVERAKALRVSNDELERLDSIIKLHMRVHAFTSRKVSGAEISRKAIYRFFRSAGESGVDLILLALADTRATYDHTLTQEHWTAALDVSRTLLEAWYEKADELIRPPQLLNGDDIIQEFKQKPGPDIGKILEAIREAQAGGNLSTRAEALAFVHGWLAKAREK